MENFDFSHSSKSASDKTCPSNLGDDRSKLTLGGNQPSPPVSPSLKVNSAELKLASPVSTSVANKSPEETADVRAKGYSSREFEAVETLLFLSSSSGPRKEASVNTPAPVKEKASINTPALMKENSPASPDLLTPPVTPVVEKLADRDAASWKNLMVEDQHEALRLLICSPAGVYSHIPILAGFNSLALAKTQIHHPSNGAEHPSFAWAMIMILSLVPGHEMYTVNLVRTILGLWPNITKQATAALKLEKGKRTLSAQITKASPVIQNVKSGMDDLMEGKQYRIVRLVRQGEVVVMGPSKKTVEGLDEKGATEDGPATKENSTSAKTPRTTEKKVPGTVSKKRAAKDDDSTLAKRQKTQTEPKKALPTAENSAATSRAAAKSSLGKHLREGGRGRTMGDVIGKTRYQTLNQGSNIRAPILAKDLWEARKTKGLGWETANAGFVQSKISA